MEPVPSRRPQFILIFLFFLIASCHGEGDRPPHPRRDTFCPSGPGETFRTFLDDGRPALCPDETGGGAFGHWMVDSHDLPAFRYTLDHHRDSRASYFTSWGESRDHWHQLGNDAVTATAHNEGYLQLWHWGRGGKCINRYRPGTGDHSGGFRFVKSGRAVWNTLYDPASFDEFHRDFGLGYFQKETLRDGLLLRERLFVPYGDDPVVVSETEVENLAPEAREISLYEYWDSNLCELLPAPIMTAPLGRVFEEARWAFNENFLVSTAWDEIDRILFVTPHLAPGVCPPAMDAVSTEDYYPASTFLAPLIGEPDAWHTDQDRFFGGGGPFRPDAVASDLPSALLPGPWPEIGKACLVFRKDLRLGPGEKRSVSYAFGYGPREDIPGLVERYREAPEEHFETTLDSWTQDRVDFVTPEAPWLRREMLWHGYYLPAGAFYEDYFDSHIVNQGSAYAYTQGFNGAHRDFSLFCLPLVYIRPDLAREILTYTMRSQDPDTGKIPYMHQGHGFTTGALVHEESTDLDLFFLLAASEYLGATRDFSFLDEEVPFYPLSLQVSGPVRDHLTRALDHLEHSVGTGPHGLIRAGSGDWNDVLIAFSPHPLLTMTLGESNLNTAMACFVLPRIAGLLRDRMPLFSERAAGIAAGLAPLLDGEWTGEWMRRGYLGDGTWLGEDRLFLDAQPWALLAGIWDEGRARTLLRNIEEMLAAPSPAGLLCLYPPNTAPYLVPGSDTNGGTWAAVDSWTAWAWSLYDPAGAWRCFLKSTLYRHAGAYPDIWYGVWSGPDSYNAMYAERPGETFNWSFTPMTDFPVMNMNRHSGPLLAAIKLAGIDPCGDSITIDPRLPFPCFSLRLPLLGISYLEDRARGYYRPANDGAFRFRLRLPRDLSGRAVRFFLNGRAATPEIDNGFVQFEMDARRGEKITWEVQPDGF